MGNCSLQNDRGDVYKEMGTCDFSFKQIIGRGGFGKVASEYGNWRGRCGGWKRRRRRKTSP